MRNLVWLGAMAASFCAAQSPAARRECPPNSVSFPWSVNVPKHVEGDFWAEVYLELNDKGRVKRCSLGKNNMSSPELRSRTCRSFVKGWTDPTPKQDLTADGKAKRSFRILGKRHINMLKEARKKWLSEHPSERPECYPFSTE